MKKKIQVPLLPCFLASRFIPCSRGALSPRSAFRFFVVLLCVLCASSSFAAPQAVYVNPDGSIVNTTDFKFAPGKLFSNGLAVDSSLAAKVDKTTTVNTHPLSANITVTQSDVGLGNADNTSDANKPVSTAQAAAIALKVDKTTTVNTHPLSANVTVTQSDVGLGNLTNDAQTKAAIVPNTAPASGQVLVGNAGATAYAPQAVIGDATFSANGTLIITKTNGISFAPSATTDTTNAANISSGTLNKARLPAALGARVDNNAAISISNATWTILTFNTERFDTDTIHDTSTNTGRLTCKTAGKYLITGTVEFASNATGVRFAAISLNATAGTGFIAVDTTTAVSGFATAMTVSTVFDLAVNDFVTLQVYQNSTAALNVNQTANYSPEFSMIWMGP